MNNRNKINKQTNGTMKKKVNNRTAINVMNNINE